MGKQGSSINKCVDKKVAEDFNETDLRRVANERVVGFTEVGVAAAAAEEAAATQAGRVSRRRDVGSVLASRHAKPKAVPVLSFVQRVVAIDPNLTQSDQLITHIKKHNLKLEEYLTTRSNGDCFYDALFNLVKLNNLPIPTSNPLELRRFIISSLDSNPNFQLWLSSPTVWRQSKQIFKEFKIRHSKPGVFTDWSF